jgi:uncharacterized protein YjiS (DUF1127 family)
MLDHILTKVQSRAAIPTRPSGVVEKVMRSLESMSLWIELHRQRVYLEELEDYQLADLGISRSQVRKECSKWPWQP